MANYNLCITASNGGGFNPVFLVKYVGSAPTSGITITSITANGYSTGFPCTSSVGTIQKSTPITFFPSSFPTAISPTSITGSWTFGNFVSITYLVINGTPINTNGTTITNGSDSVTVYFGECIVQSTFNCPTIPDPSPSPTPTLTQTPSITPSLTVTPTNTKTPTQTPTNTVTPSVTPIICGSGITTGSYFYVDCCGVSRSGISIGETITLNYSYPFTVGVNKLNVEAIQSCPTKTPTPTTTVTPSITQTSTITPSPSVTNFSTPSPTSTPTQTPVFKPQNECDTFTLFDLGISCNVIKEPSTNQNNGILKINITGGTSPYSIYWNGVLGKETMYNLSSGLYQIKVIDYYGDYTANTICSLIQPTQTVTPTTTQTPSTSIPAVYSKLCLIALGSQNYGPLQFNFSGYLIGKPYWTSGSYNIVWKTNRWVVVGSDLSTPVTFNGGGIFVSQTTSLPPLAGWVVNGGTQLYSITVTEGDCPSKLPLFVNVTKQNSTCNSITNCDGSITVQAQNGTPPYQYSINNGLNWVNSNIFQGLCPSTYTVLTRDSAGTQLSNSVVISSSQQPKTYQLQITSQPDQTQVITSPNYSQKITKSKVETVPALPQGVSITTVLNVQSSEINNGPGFGLANNIVTVLKNGIAVSPSNLVSNSQTSTRPDCSPESQFTLTDSYQFPITITNTDVIEIQSSSTLTITNGQISTQTNCVTQIINNVSANLSQSIINGCSCCSISSDSSIVKINDNSVSYVVVDQSSTCTTIYLTMRRGTGSCADQTQVDIVLYPSPYNLDSLSFGVINANLYTQPGCEGIETYFVQNLNTSLSKGTALKQVCFPTPWGFTQSFNITNITIDSILMNNGYTYTKNGRCYKVVLGGCSTVPPPP